MIERLCQLLLRRAAGKWPNESEMLTEWRAELCTMNRARDRLWYALSLAASRPHRTRTIPLWRTVPGLASSLLLLLALPYFFTRTAIGWWGSFSSDTIVRQSWQAAASAMGAVVLGIACARMTSGVTHAVRPSLLPVWVFGVPFGFGLALILLAPYGVIRADLIDTSAWFAGAVVFGILVVRLTLHGRKAAAWTLVAVATPILFLLGSLHGLTSIPQGHMGEFFGGSTVAGTVFLLATSPTLYVNLFGLAYVRGLAARVRSSSPDGASNPVAEGLRRIG